MSLYFTEHARGAYPKNKYAITGGMVVVHNSAEERALGDGWVNSPPPEQPAAPAKKAGKAK